MRKYTINGVTTSSTFSTTKMLAILTTGANAAIWLDYVACDGQALTSASALDIALVRVTGNATSMTSYTPKLLDPDDATAQAAGSATTGCAVFVSTQTDPTTGDVLWRRSGNTQGGGGIAEWFPPGQIAVRPAGGTTQGRLGLAIQTTLSAAAILTYTLHFTEIG